MKFMDNVTKKCVAALILLLAVSFLSSCSNDEASSQKHLEAADNYFVAKNYKAAEIELRNVLQIDPRNEKAYIQLSQVYRNLKNPGEELKALMQVTALNPENMEAQFRLAQVYLLGKQTPKARKIVQIILAKQPEDIKALHMLATVQVQERNADAAIKTLNRAIEIAPENIDLHLFLGFLQYYHKKDFQKAEVSYLKAISIDSSVAESYEELVNIYKLEKKFDRLENLLVYFTNTEGDRISKLTILANYYEEQKQLQKAEDIYKKIIEVSNQNHIHVYNLGVFYARYQNYESAIDYFKQALALNDTLETRVDLANVYLDQNNYEEAKKQALLILQKKSNHIQGKLIFSQTLMVEKKYTKAFKTLEELLAIDNKNTTAYYLKAVCLLEEDLKELPGQEIRMAEDGSVSAQLWKRGLAIENLRSAIKLSPDYFIARLMLADIYIKNKELVLADQQIKYILEQNPSNFRAYFMLGNLKIIKQEWGAAEQIFSKIAERVPNFSLAHVKLGVIYNAQKQSERAIEEFKLSLNKDPLNMNALRYITNTYMTYEQKQRALQLLDEHFIHPALTVKEKGYIEFLKGEIAISGKNIILAKKHLNASIKLYDKTTPAYEALATLSEMDNNTFVPIKYYELILSYDPKYIPAYMSLSRIYQSTNDIEKAKESLEAVLEINDNHVMAANDLAYILVEEGNDLQKAMHLALVAESQDPNNPLVLDTLGWIYYKQKDYDLAIHKLKGSIKGDSDNPVTNYHLGWVYYDSGKYEKARGYMENALKLNPNFDGAENARNILGQ